jgi:Protein of unknown function (DUF3347)
MKKVLLGLLILFLAVAGYVVYKFSVNKGGGDFGEKAERVEKKSASPLFDAGIKSMMTSYFTMKDAFVNADTTAAKAACKAMITAIDSLNMEEFKNDTSGLINTVQPFINDAKSNAVSLLAQTSIKEMRLDFNQLNQQLFPLLSAIKYKEENLYWQNCPMAFDGDKEANWIDNKSGKARTNPYLGKNDPKYGSGMLNCGEDKDSIIAK